MKIINPKLFYSSILKSTLKISIAGIIIGYFHAYDFFLAIGLFFKIIHSIYSLGFKNNQKNWIVLFGALFTGALGMISEFWGITNQYWEYHDVNKNLPLWLPFAWMLAFTFLYKTERDIFASLKSPSFKTKAIITSLLVIIFPAIGEAITINFGVWTYHWSYQIFGVPAFAFLCLLTLHSIINYTLYSFCKKRNIKDPVYN